MEALDPTSGLHVLRPDEVEFDDPTPTSGPHAPGVLAGVFTETMPGAVQVGHLEQGGVIISVDSGTDDVFAEASGVVRSANGEGERSSEPSIADLVMVQPVDDLPATVVVTAWRSRISCSEYDSDYISWFIDDRSGRPDLNPEHSP